MNITYPLQSDQTALVKALVRGRQLANGGRLTLQGAEELEDMEARSEASGGEDPIGAYLVHQVPTAAGPVLVFRPTQRLLNFLDAWEAMNG